MSYMRVPSTNYMLGVIKSGHFEMVSLVAENKYKDFKQITQK